ncbi:MAG: GNAT family N-acetyltransferase [Alphaproteobacteria bacterium]|nr:GNAT family N-acetyltransferase [Alphaproteobacteria bacterium]
MNDLAPSVRTARPDDAADLARIYIESWQDTYAGVISHALLTTMSRKSHTARWQATIKSNGTVLVAEDEHHGVIGLCSLGAVRDGGVGFEGEIYTLYVDPSFLGRGTGRALLAGAFDAFKARKLRSCLIWAHARNNACFFYEAMGGQRVATRTTRLMGELTPEIGFGWKKLATQKQTRTIQS